MAIVNYRILRGDDRSDLRTKVRDRLAQGWIPQGGVAISWSRDRDYAMVQYFYQAMIKDDGT